MAYFHRIDTEELATNVAVPSPSSDVQVVIGAMPVNMAEDPAATVNRPVLINSFDEAVKKLGYSDDFASYPACQSIDLNFRVFNSGPVVVINVLDPETYKKANAPISVPVAEKVASVPVTGIIPTSLEVEVGAPGTDGEGLATEDISLPAADEVFGEMKAGDLCGRNTKILADGSVVGTFPYIRHYNGAYGGNEDYQHGHYFVFRVNGTGAFTVTVEGTKVSSDAPGPLSGNVEDDNQVVIRLDDENGDCSKATVKVQVGEGPVTTLNFEKAKFLSEDQPLVLTEGVDYMQSFYDDGSLKLTFVDAFDQDFVTVISESIDPAQVKKTDIIGSYNTETGAVSGLEALRLVYHCLDVAPGIVIAPGWSSDPEVAVVMALKVREINQKFHAIACIDIDSAKYKKYTIMAEARRELGISSSFAVLVWPKLKRGDKVYDFSAVWAAMTAYTDIQNGNVPFKSPSNKLINMSATVLADGTELLIDVAMAEAINEQGIVTAINDGGFRSYGNNTSAYPDNTDPKDRWISCRRMMNWYRNRFVRVYRDKVDDPTNYRLIESVVDAENMYLNSLKSAEQIAGGEISFNEDENPIEQILAGKIVFHVRIAFWLPTEYILARIEFDPGLIEEALAGGE